MVAHCYCGKTVACIQDILVRALQLRHNGWEKAKGRWSSSCESRRVSTSVRVDALTPAEALLSALPSRANCSRMPFSHLEHDQGKQPDDYRDEYQRSPPVRGHL